MYKVVFLLCFIIFSCNTNVNVLTDDVLIYNILEEYKFKNQLKFELLFNENINLKDKSKFKQYDLIFSKYNIDINLSNFSRFNSQKIDKEELYDFFYDFIEKNNKKIIPYTIDFLIIKYIDKKFSNISKINDIMRIDLKYRFDPTLSKINKYEFLILGDNLFLGNALKIEKFKKKYEYYYSNNFFTNNINPLKYRNIDKDYYLESDFFNFDIMYFSNINSNKNYSYNFISDITTSSIKQRVIYHNKILFKDENLIYNIINYTLSYKTQLFMTNESINKTIFYKDLYLSINRKSLLESILTNKSDIDTYINRLYYPFLGSESKRYKFYNNFEYLIQQINNDKILEKDIFTLLEKKFTK